jgi:putative hydrolase of the HAD superfamily
MFWMDTPTAQHWSALAHVEPSKTSSAPVPGTVATYHPGGEAAAPFCTTTDPAAPTVAANHGSAIARATRRRRARAGDESPDAVRLLRPATTTMVARVLPDSSESRLVIRAVMFDFGGVISSSPFEAFARFEHENGLPPDFIRTVNATNPDDNAWARLERSEVDLDEFGTLWSAEARALGHDVDGRLVLQMLSGAIRPRMVAAVRTCRTAYKTACLTNNFLSAEAVVSEAVAEVYALFDAVLESSALGVRKPDPRFYEMACEAVGVLPDEAVFLDDLGMNLKPARALGMHTIKVTDPDEALAELARVTGLSFSG